MRRTKATSCDNHKKPDKIIHTKKMSFTLAFGCSKMLCFSFLKDLERWVRLNSSTPGRSNSNFHKFCGIQFSTEFMENVSSFYQFTLQWNLVSHGFYRILFSMEILESCFPYILCNTYYFPQILECCFP